MKSLQMSAFSDPIAERHGVRLVRDRVVADRAPGHAAHRHVVRPLQLQPARLLLRRRHDLQQGQVHLLGLLVQSGEKIS